MEEAMYTRTMFLSRLIGLYCIVAALAMFLRGPAIVDTVILLLRDAPLVFVVGIATLAAGLAIVLAHNVWSGGAAAIIVTVIGWLTVIKGVLFLALTPDGETAFFLQGLRFQQFFHIYAAIWLVFGAYLAWCGFRKPLA
jgi:vacuolar-type H+-ATPase subunit I/STV1